MTQPQKRQPSFKAPKFFWTLFLTSVVLFCILGKIQIGIEEERKLEEIKQEHIETTMRLYAEYAKKYNEEERELYQDSIDSISAVDESDSLPSGNFR
jgi:hypothetical protein